MTKPILSFDLDMTLVDHKTWTISSSVLHAIHTLRERFLIVIATGRNLDDLLGTPYKEQLLPDAIIHLNGSRISVKTDLLHADSMDSSSIVIQSPKQQGYLDIYHHTMKSDLVASLLTFASKHHICLGAHQDGYDYFTHPQILEQADQLRFGESNRVFTDPYRLLQLPVYSLTAFRNRITNHIAVTDTTLASTDLLFGHTPVPFSPFESLQEAFPEIRVIPFSNGIMADISEQQISKASAMRRLVTYWNTDMDSVIAFGDDQNDLELLQTAHIGIAMGNACQAVKQAADYVTAPIDQDGVLQACRHFHIL